MPFVLSGAIRPGMPALWGEGSAYERQSIYQLDRADHPPVNYDRHELAPHSIPHVDAPAHIISGGGTIDQFFSDSERIASFFGRAWVVRLPGDGFSSLSSSTPLKLWRVSEETLRENILRVTGSEEPPEKLILTAEAAPTDSYGFSDPQYVLVLSVGAAEYLLSNPRFNAYGTSWKSTDFEPGSRERPVHRLLLQQALLFEYLALSGVPEGEYFFSAFPLNLTGASESPVTPVLFSREEMKQTW